VEGAAAGEAQRIRREAEEYAEATRRRADAFAEARIRRVRELTDRLVATAETVERRFGEAAAIRSQLDDLVAALGAAAERAARELEGSEPDDPIEVYVGDTRRSAPRPPLS
jgi:hypothetical protein